MILLNAVHQLHSGLVTLNIALPLRRRLSGQRLDVAATGHFAVAFGVLGKVERDRWESDST
jgi:hypothetical protein